MIRTKLGTTTLKANRAAIAAFHAAKRPGCIPHTRTSTTFGVREGFLAAEMLDELLAADAGWDRVEWGAGVLRLESHSRFRPATDEVSWEVSPLAGKRVLFYFLDDVDWTSFDPDFANPYGCAEVYALPDGLDREWLAGVIVNLYDDGDGDLEGTGVGAVSFDLFGGADTCEVWFTVEDETVFLEWAAWANSEKDKGDED